MADLDNAVNVSISNDAHFILLTISDKAGTARLVNNLEEVVSRGDTFLPYPFSITLPTQEEGKPTELELTIDNVDQRLVDEIRRTIDPPDVKIEMVLSSKPDTVYRVYDYLRLANVRYTAMTITGTLVSNDFLNRQFPACTYDGTQFPDLMF